MTHPFDEAEQEMTKALDEIMEKYQLIMQKPTLAEKNKYWFTRFGQYAFDMNDVCKALLPIEYRKVKK